MGPSMPRHRPLPSRLPSIRIPSAPSHTLITITHNSLRLMLQLLPSCLNSFGAIRPRSPCTLFFDIRMSRHILTSRVCPVQQCVIGRECGRVIGSNMSKCCLCLGSASREKHHMGTTSPPSRSCSSRHLLQCNFRYETYENQLAVKARRLVVGTQSYFCSIAPNFFASKLDYGSIGMQLINGTCCPSCYYWQGVDGSSDHHHWTKCAKASVRISDV
jgi:hypothetical protein